jgi:hypothetical protein
MYIPHTGCELRPLVARLLAERSEEENITILEKKLKKLLLKV